jgi:hypothetical protein
VRLSSLLIVFVGRLGVVDLVLLEFMSMIMSCGDCDDLVSSVLCCVRRPAMKTKSVVFVV